MRAPDEAGLEEPLQQLRRALYRRGAGAAELEAYRAAAAASRALREPAEAPPASVVPTTAAPHPAPPGPEAQPAPPPRPRRRPLIVVGAALGLALVAGIGVAMLEPAPGPHPAAAPTAHPVTTPRPTLTVTRQVTRAAHAMDLADLPPEREAALLVTGFRSMASAAADDARNELLSTPDGSVETTDAANALDDGGTSEGGTPTISDAAYVRAHAAQFGGGGLLQLQVVTKQAASWTWRVSVLDRSSRAVRTAFLVAGSRAHGRLQSVSLRLAADEIPAGMTLVVTPATPYFWAATYRY